MSDQGKGSRPPKRQVIEQKKVTPKRNFVLPKFTESKAEEPIAKDDSKVETDKGHVVADEIREDLTKAMLPALSPEREAKAKSNIRMLLEVVVSKNDVNWCSLERCSD